MAITYTDKVWYVSSVGYTSVSSWVANTITSVGNCIRPNSPTAGNERVYVCTAAGTTNTATEPTWTYATRGQIQPTDGSVTWQECSGQAAVNGDLTNTLTWASYASKQPPLGMIIKNNAGTYYFICTVSGTCGSLEPSWTLTAGSVLNTDGGTTWICLGAIGVFSAWGAPSARISIVTAATYANGGTLVATFFLANNHAETQSTALSLAFQGGTIFNRILSETIPPPFRLLAF